MPIMTDETTHLLKRLILVVLFSIAFAYIETAIVVYRRAIDYPSDHFRRRTEQHRCLANTDLGRPAATLVLIVTAAWLFGVNRQARTAYFLLILAVWKIFYYVWLKVLTGWPTSILDWDFRCRWASPVLYRILVSLLVSLLAVAILLRSAQRRPLSIKWSDWIGWSTSAIIVIVAFWLGNRDVAERGLGLVQWSHPLTFPKALFFLGYGAAVAACVRTLVRGPKPPIATGDS